MSNFVGENTVFFNGVDQILYRLGTCPEGLEQIKFLSEMRLLSWAPKLTGETS